MFKVYAEGKSFIDFSLIIVPEIYIIFRSELIGQMNSGPYSLGINGSNDESGIKKLNLVLICLLDDNKGKAQLLDMEACKEDTAEVLFNNIDSILRKNKVDFVCLFNLFNVGVRIYKVYSI